MSIRDTSKKFDSVSLYRIRKLLADLSNKTGRGTELVTLYLPPKKPVHEAIAALREESGTASNIKSDTTRNHVQDALTKTMARLRLYKQTPENGLVIFCGAIPGPGGPGNETIELYEVLPQKPVSNYLYRCDDHFHLDPLRDMLREQNVIGILALDATEAGLGIVSGDMWDVVDTMSSGVSGKTRKGGQCVSHDTLVQLDDGSVVDISKTTQGSKIVSYNFATFRREQHNIADNFSFVPSEYYEIETGRPQLRIKVTPEHRFFSLDEGGVATKQAFQLLVGNRVLVSRKLPEASHPSLETRFRARYIHTVDDEGRSLLKKLRFNMRKSQARLASELDLHQAEISQLERGERNLEGSKLQKIIAVLCNSTEQFNKEHVSVRRVLPEYFTPQLLQLMGYITGDGRVSDNRVALHEQRLDLAEQYSRLISRILGLSYVPIIRKNRAGKGASFAKNEYYEIRIYSKDFADGLRELYPGVVSATLRDIPEAIQRLDNSHLSSYVRGLFDAEGYVRERRLGISMKSGAVIKKLQILLLRFGIVSSYRTYTNKYGSLMHSLDIGDHESVALFRDKIGLSARDKSDLLQKCASRAAQQSYLNVPIVGSSLDKKAKALGIRRRQFNGVTNFSDTHGISKSVFAKIVKVFRDELNLSTQSTLDQGRTKVLQQIVDELSAVSESDLILAHVRRITPRKNTQNELFYDIELPETKSFVGNGFVLHNSARRYERLREMELTDYFNRLADHSKKAFLEQYTVKGLIVSGPGPTKDEFLKDRYLDYRLQNVVVGTLDTGYAGREGVRETIEKSGKLLENVRVVEERKLVQKFLREVNSMSGLAIYGINDVLAALKKSAVDTILVNDDIDTFYEKATCRKCGNIVEKFITRSQLISEKQTMLTCQKCGSNEIDFYERDIVDFLADASVDSGANVEVISSKTEDGAMMKNFGGVSALLRYRV